MISIAIFCQPLHPAQMPLNAHQKIIIIITTGMMHLSTTQTKCYEEDWNHLTVPPLHFTFRSLHAVALLFQISPGRAFCCLGMTTWLTYIFFLPYSLSNYANQLEICHLWWALIGKMFCFDLPACELGAKIYNSSKQSTRCNPNINPFIRSWISARNALHCQHDEGFSL